jgi:hypothetical protein
MDQRMGAFHLRYQHIRLSFGVNVQLTSAFIGLGSLELRIWKGELRAQSSNLVERTGTAEGSKK